MKNEGSYLVEWLEFHKIVGVERFYLYDNNSSDSTVEIVRPYLEYGEVVYHKWPYQAGQKPAYLHCLKNYNRESEWIAFIDLDEFLFPSKIDDLREVLSDFLDYPAVVVNWFVFGNSGHEQKPLGLQIENYTKRAKISKYGGSKIIKSIVRPEQTLCPINPHAFRYLKGKPVSENKKSLSIGTTATRVHSVKKIRINHYLTRSSEELRAKVMRGRAGSIKKKKNFSQLDSQQPILNEVEDLTIQRFIPELKIALEKKEKSQAEWQEIKTRKNLDLKLYEGSQPLEPVASRGYLAKVAIDGQELFLSGWAASLYLGCADGFKLSIAGEELKDFECTCGLPSPKIQQNYSYLDRANKAKFELRVPLNQEQIEKYRNSLIFLTPLFWFPKYAGCLLINVLTPTIPVPPSNAKGQLTRKFNSIAFEWLGYLIQKVGLSPTDRFLEVGCGAGHITYGLAYYLQPTGSYQGFDVADRCISWAKKEIATRKSNFNFDRHDIYHPVDNPSGTLAAEDFIFPYPDSSFDCACIPHLLINLSSTEVRHYLKEISRVLKPGGRCLLACLWLDSELEEAIAPGNSDRNPSLTANAKMPLREALLLKWIEELGFRVLDKSYGSWCGRLSCHYHDLLVLEKSP